jgi:hypothetical protein
VHYTIKENKMTIVTVNKLLDMEDELTYKVLTDKDTLSLL